MTSFKTDSQIWQLYCMLLEDPSSPYPNNSTNPYMPLFTKDIYTNPNILCQCKASMEYMCVSNCKYASLHCGNKQCNLSNRNHELCKIIKLDGLTKLLSLHIEPHSSFFTAIFQIQEKFILELRQRRQQLVDSIRYRGFQDEERVAIEEIYVQKNAKFSKGVHINELYDKLAKRKDNYNIAEEQIKLYQKEIERIHRQLDQLLQLIIKDQSLQSKFTNLMATSKILTSKSTKTQQQIAFIIKSLEQPKGFKLLFRASEHNFSAAKFYEHCDQQTNVLVLIKTQFGNIIGGYNHYGWSSLMHGKYTVDEQKRCFIFSVDLMQKMDLVNKNNSIFNNKAYGPIFGSGHDIYLSDRCNNNNNSYAYFPYSYNFTAKPYSINQQCYKAFCGAQHGYDFSVIEYEVFKVIR